jgi:peptidyl-prolyl cis-trans isomerase A (cyclophilin A)
MRPSLLLPLLPFALFAASLAGQGAPTTPPGAAAPAAAPVPVARPRVRINTSCGPIVLELEPAAAPRTVANFLAYVKDGHYKGTIFHRVVDGFMIQGGGHLEDLTEKPTRPTIPSEAAETFQAGLRNVKGSLALARTEDPASGGAQFYINTVDNPSLDWKDRTPQGTGYCVFGRVVEGMEAVARIEKVHVVWRKGLQNVPEYAVRIRSAEILP